MWPFNLSPTMCEMCTKCWSLVLFSLVWLAKSCRNSFTKCTSSRQSDAPLWCQVNTWEVLDPGVLTGDSTRNEIAYKKNLSTNMIHPSKVISPNTPKHIEASKTWNRPEPTLRFGDVLKWRGVSQVLISSSMGFLDFHRDFPWHPMETPKGPVRSPFFGQWLPESSPFAAACSPDRRCFDH